MADYTVLYVLSAFIGLIVIFLLVRGIHFVQPYEQGIVVLFGAYKRVLNPGFNWVIPFASVMRVDLRTEVLEVPRQEVITKDNSPTNVDAIIYTKVVDPPKAIFQVQNYHIATVALAQTTLRSIIGDMELDEILFNRERINTRLRDILDEATDKWGVRVDAVEIKEVDPVGPVKAAMEEQTAAERQRRAAVLRADGEKRSAILVSEGQKRSRILQAEGVRQSQILEAEGARVATILSAQGEAQRLRILSLGSSVLDAKALTVLSLDTVQKVGDGQATKILFPFEFSRLMEGASEFLGTSRGVPDRTLNALEDLEKRVGTMDDILGPIPKQEELMTDIKSIEQELKSESDDTMGIVAPRTARAATSTTPQLPPAELIAPPPPEAGGRTRGYSSPPPVHRPAEPHGAPPSFHDAPPRRPVVPSSPTTTDDDDEETSTS